jgi:hypothetical protein
LVFFSAIWLGPYCARRFFASASVRPSGDDRQLFLRYTFAPAVGDSSRRQAIRQVKARHANPVVGHPVIDVEAVRRAKIVAPVDAGGEHDVGDGPLAFLRQQRRQHRLRRTIADEAADAPSRAPSPRPSSTSWCPSLLGVHDFAHAVINDQPAVPGQDGRSAAADFEPLPGRHGSRQPVMRGERPRRSGSWPSRPSGSRKSRCFPDRDPRHGTRRGRRFPPDECREKRPVEHGQFRVPGWIGNGDGEEAGIFVIHVADFDAVIRPKVASPRRCQWKRSADRPRRCVGLGPKMPCKS